MTTKLASNQILGSTVNVFDYMAAAQITDVTFNTGSVDVPTAGAPGMWTAWVNL